PSLEDWPGGRGSVDRSRRAGRLPPGHGRPRIQAGSGEPRTAEPRSRVLCGTRSRPAAAPAGPVVLQTDDGGLLEAGVPNTDRGRSSPIGSVGRALSCPDTNSPVPDFPPASD